MFNKTILKNGLRLITVPIASAQSATVLVLVQTGSKYESKKVNGVSHFLEHMFFKGTEKRPDSQAVAEFLDKVGGQHNAFTGKEYTGYYAKLAPEYLDMGLDWVSDILLNSKFDETEINRERGVIIEEINMYLDMPQLHVGELWEELLYGDQPAGWPIAGSKESVGEISRQTFLDYISAHYKAESLLVVLAGHLPGQTELTEKVKKYFGGLATGEGSGKEKTKEIQTEPEALVHFKETDQTHLCLGVRGYDIFHPDRYVLTLLATMLGGMASSRIFISVRDKQGLAYYVRTSAEEMTDSGYLVTQGGVANDKVQKAISAILAEYKKIRDEEVSAQELRKAKDYLKGTTQLALETSDEMGGWIGLQEILKKEILTPEQVFAKIEAVGADDLARVAKDIFQSQKLNLALIGPFKEESKDEFRELLKI